MSYRDFMAGLSAEQVARRRQIQREAEDRAREADEDEFVSILQPIPAEEITQAELAERLSLHD